MIDDQKPLSGPEPAEELLDGPEPTEPENDQEEPTPPADEPLASTTGITGAGPGPYAAHRPKPETVPETGEGLGGGVLLPDGGRPATPAEQLDESELYEPGWIPNTSYEQWVRGQRERPGDIGEWWEQ